MSIGLVLCVNLTSLPNIEGVLEISHEADGSLTLVFDSQESAAKAVRDRRQYGYMDAVGFSLNNNRYGVHMCKEIINDYTSV